MVKNIIVGVFICFLCKSPYSQDLDLVPITVKKWVNSDTLILDSCSINPRTFQILDLNGNKYPGNYKVDARLGKVFFSETPFDTLIIQYHRLILDFSKNYFIHPIRLNIPEYQKHFYKPIEIETSQNEKEFFRGTSLNRTGSISRGLMVGNNQDFSLNSNLNLQLSGMLSPSMKILASVTDDNIPIQPQGNTQQLQDFDKVFIRISERKWELTAGDFWVKNQDGYFLRYNKRGQGVLIKNQLENNQTKITTENSASISKGKFGRNVIQGIEGSQGPYRLFGNENENFIIILSGTENVYIDGNLLKRGQNNDYTIDYNTAEITFTANTLITKDKRIIIEFQYSDKNYARSLLQSSTIFEKNNSSFFIYAYGEQDSKNQPLQQDFDLSDRVTLENIGDNIDLAIGSGIDSIGFNENFNMYKKIDSLGYELYQYSNNQQEAIYQLVFSNVGDGNGDYILKENNALGKIFEWVAPDTIQLTNIIKNGNYSPVKKLVTPKKRQIVTIGGQKKWRSSNLKYELSSSNMDLNTLSKLGNQDNLGLAGRVIYDLQKKINDEWVLKQEIGIESISKNYERIERFREVEFERNWNIQQLTSKEDQILTTAKLYFNHSKNGFFKYGFNSYLIREDFNGYKNDFKIKWNKKFYLDFDGSLLNSKGIFETNFLRHQTKFYVPLNKWKIGFEDINENNQFFKSDTLSNNSYRFYDWKFYLENLDSSKNLIRFFYQERYDWFKNSSILDRATKAVSPGLNIGIVNNQKFRLNYSIAYRILEILDTTLTNILPETSLASRLNYNLKMWRGSFTTNSFIEIGSGLELQKEFIYLEVPAGQGIYTWNDYNENNIKELNEFEIAAFNDQASYIRVYTPNNTYTKIYNFQYNQNINIDFKKLVKEKVVLKKLLDKFYNQTALNTQKKTNELDWHTLINPLVNADNSIIQQMSNSLRNSLFFNRSSSKYSIELVTQLFANKNLLINGTDFKSIQKEKIKLRWNLNKTLMLNSHVSNEIKNNSSTYMVNRNFSITSREFFNRFSYQPNTLFRIAFKSRYSEKSNSEAFGDEKAFLNDFGIEIRRSKRDKGLLNAELHFVKINYNGQSNSTIGFEMLEGLQIGSNITWKVGFQKNMSKNLQLSVSYNGRKSEENRAIHTGSMQMRAFF